MVNVHVFLGTGYPATAMVDTGCSWPMSLPQALADVLVKRGLAIRAGKTTSMLADGSQHDVDVIMIKAINVEGRVLQDVEASVSPGDSAPILLGLGALNRLGPFKIEEGGSSLPAINQHDPRIARLAGASGRAGLAGHGGLHHRP
jgi:predicted aspartyl protease